MQKFYNKDMTNTDFIYSDQWPMLHAAFENITQTALIAEHVKKYIWHRHPVDRDAINRAIGEQCDALLTIDALLNYNVRESLLDPQGETDSK